MFQTLYIYIWRSKGMNVKAISSVAPGDADIEQVKTGTLSVICIQTHDDGCTIRQLYTGSEKAEWNSLPNVEPIIKHTPPEAKKATRKRKSKVPEAQQLPTANEVSESALPMPKCEEIQQEASEPAIIPNPDPEPSKLEETKLDELIIDSEEAFLMDEPEMPEEEFEDKDNTEEFEKEGKEEKDDEFEFDTVADSDTEEIDLGSDDEDEDTEPVEESAPETAKRRGSLRNRFTRSKRVADNLEDEGGIKSND